MSETTKYDKAEIEARVQALFDEGEDLSEASRRRIVELGAQATPRLVSILADRRLWDDQAPGAGFAPIHAVEILGEVGDEAALGPLFDAYRRVDPDAILDDALTDAIRGYGEAAVRAGRRALESWDDPFLEDLAYLFAGLGVHHTKALQVLLKYFLKHPVPGAELLAEYGDPLAADALRVALDRYIVASDGQTTYRRPIFALADAIEELGGELSDQERDAIERIKARRTLDEEVLDKLAFKKAPDDSATVVNERELGRNDPCWCGSGKKYKRCHWVEDHR